MRHSLRLLLVLLLLFCSPVKAALWGNHYIQNDVFGYCQDRRLSPDTRIEDCTKAAHWGSLDVHHLLSVIDALAGAFEDKSEFAGAAKILSHAVEVADNSNAPIQHYLRGMAYLNNGQKDLAAADFEAAQKEGGELYGDPGLAEIAAADGQYGKAIQLYSKAIALDESNANMFQVRAHVYARMGEYEKAMADDESAIEESRNDSGSFASRCWDRAVLNRDLDAAEADCAHALDLLPDDPYTLDDFGLVFFREKKWDKAIEKYDAALKHNPYLASSLYMRGICDLREGKTGDGQAYIKQALTIYPQIRDRYAIYGISP